MMTQKPKAGHFNEQVSQGYDARAQKVGEINANIHLLTRLVLSKLPADARILCVGVGTGSEIVPLAEAFNGWSFVGVDPSGPMLDVCRMRLQEKGLLSRTELIEGFLADVPKEQKYDAVLCFLVTHFIQDDAERLAMFKDMGERVRTGGYLINTDISYDMNAPEFPDMLEVWKEMHKMSGTTQEQAGGILKSLQDHVGVRSPEFIRGLLQKSGFPRPVQFAQSLLIHGWFSQKP